MFEDETPKPKKIDLERFSVDDLQARIDALRSEIADCEAELKRKKGVKDIAESLFDKRD